ncbi:OsmC family peroxiredoxin [Spirosoma sp. HMF3257]|uniref:OsmC family peroxiredoxin n=1 Tax=Spirosoma telluris TaxID=2183553 RepID=A0A327NKB3_9BACT|nr:OsmC family peroxiredoxin [Spirosoma telluris]RAI74486.1 OsmC family peroxiredoxin [Spirosoma telluris]
MIDSQPVDTIQEYTTMQVELVRVDDAFHFEALGKSGVAQHIDAATDIGGHNAGARPMEMMLMGLAGCSAIDVILILKKQKQVLDDFRLKVDGLREKDAIPAPFKKIHITYLLKGQLDPEKVKRAIDLSMDKYCSATAQLRPSTEITYSFEIS